MDNDRTVDFPDWLWDAAAKKFLQQIRKDDDQIPDWMWNWAAEQCLQQMLKEWWAEHKPAPSADCDNNDSA